VQKEKDAAAGLIADSAGLLRRHCAGEKKVRSARASWGNKYPSLAVAKVRILDEFKVK
jgi:hypothetical protein